MRKSFLTRIAYTNLLWMAGLLILLFSVSGNMFYYSAESKNISTAFLEKFNVQTIVGFQLDQILQNRFFGYAFRFLLLFGSALFLQFISSEYRLIRVRSFFPLFSVLYFFCRL